MLREINRQTSDTSSALASPFSAGVSFSTSGSSFFCSGLAFAVSFTFLFLGGAYKMQQANNLLLKEHYIVIM